MENIFARDFSSFQGIFDRPAPLNNYARQKMRELCFLLKDHEVYNCPPACMQCCHGSILMSYTEFSAITLFLQENWTETQIRELMRWRVGVLKADGMLLCPFLQTEASREHCCIYPVRPLICRVFGTSAAPCAEDIIPSALDGNLFYLAHRLLYYSGNQFIALNLNAQLALFEAPFALWCLADNSKEDRLYLCDLLQERGDSFRAVLYERSEGVFFVLEKGEKKVLSVGAESE